MRASDYLCLLIGLPVMASSCKAETPTQSPARPAPQTSAQPAPAVIAQVSHEAEPTVDLSALYLSVVNAPERSEADKALDSGRKPEQLLSFFEVKPNMIVADLAAGGGYTTELLARTVGPGGKVYGQNSPFILDRFARAPWQQRLEKPVMSVVERIDSEFDDPLPAHQGDLDAVFMVIFYHDTVWFKTNRAQMNRNVFAALKPGGYFAIVDHSARPGDGVTQAQTLHRIEEATVVAELTTAGFVLEKTGDFLRNPDDQRDWNASPSQAAERRGTSDRFVLLFRKPITTTDAHPAEALPASKSIVCEEPRRAAGACSQDYRPVCATVNTGIVCIRAPCPSTEVKTFPNDCSACSDPKVISYEPGACTVTKQ